MVEMVVVVVKVVCESVYRVICGRVLLSLMDPVNGIIINGDGG